MSEAISSNCSNENNEKKRNKVWSVHIFFLCCAESQKPYPLKNRKNGVVRKTNRKYIDEKESNGNKHG